MIKYKRYIDLNNPISQSPLNTGLTSWFLPLKHKIPVKNGSFHDLTTNIICPSHSYDDTRTLLNSEISQLSYSSNTSYSPSSNQIYINSIAYYIQFLTLGSPYSAFFNLYKIDSEIAFIVNALQQLEVQLVNNLYTHNFGSVTDNEYVHITIVTSDSGGAQRIYKNGIEVSTNSNNIGTRSGSLYINYGVCIAVFYSFRSWNRSLNSDEVYNIYLEDTLGQYHNTLNYLDNKIYSFANVGGGSVQQRTQPRGNLMGVLRGVL